MSIRPGNRRRNRPDEPSSRRGNASPPRRLGHRFVYALTIASLVLSGMSRAQTAVGSERQLFIDKTLISEMSQLELKLHPPRLREEVLDFDRPWEGGNSWASSVLQDGDRYRMWYQAQSGVEVKPGWGHTGYAESRDGVLWERPALGLIDFQGSRQNNLVWDGPGGNMSVFKDERPGVPGDQRYKAVTRGRSAWGLVSADGLRWRLVQEEPILTGGPFDSHNIVFQDPWTLRYRFYGRGFVHKDLKVEFDREKHERDAIVRRFRYAMSDDFLVWSPLKLVDLPAEPLDHLYTNAAVPYRRSKGVYLMFPMRFVPGRTFHPDWTYSNGVADIVFLSSRDGVRWDRIFLEAFIRPGLDPGNWVDRAIIMGQGILRTAPDELSMYYTENYHQQSCRLRRCTIRPDGFVSVHASSGGGEFATPPLTFAGSSLYLNYSTSAVGSVRVEIQDASGAVLPGYAIDQSSEIFGDELERRVSWKSGTDLSTLAGKPVRLRFVLRDADLYSFRFQ